MSDPFSGGGTVALEAAKRGLTVYAQDLNPWPTWGLKTAFDGVDPAVLREATQSFLQELTPHAKRLYSIECSKHVSHSSTVVHTFWVRECRCPSCSETTYLYPYSLITVASRVQSEKRGFFGCSACGAVTERGLGLRWTTCDACGIRLTGEREPLLIKRVVPCAHCEAEIPYETAWTAAPKWSAVLDQVLCKNGDGEHLHFSVPSGPTRRTRVSALAAPLLEPIGEGRETGVLTRAGFKTWRDIYPPRQLQLLSVAGRVAARIVEPKVRNRIQLAIAGAGEMAGYLCRWDRFHPKAFEALANHHFSAIGMAVEVNLMAPRGRGTLPRRLAASVFAAEWAKKHLRGSSPQAGPGQDKEQTGTVTVVRGSSARQELPNRSATLVLTDPPYWDAIQYGELASPFLVWARVVTGKGDWGARLDREAVPNAVRGTGAEHYEKILRQVFIETARTLKKSGRIVLTYHGTDLRGWAALGSALRSAGLRVAALAVAHAENGDDRAKRGSLAFVKDLVIECEPGRQLAAGPLVLTPSLAPDVRELLAAGKAIATSSGKLRAVTKIFQREMGRIRTRRIYVPAEGGA